MSLRDAWVTLHHAGDGPLVSVRSHRGHGPTRLALLKKLYPAAVARLSPRQRHLLARSRVGSSAVVQVLTAHAPPKPAKRGGAPTAAASASGCSPDPNNCDYYVTTFYDRNSSVNTTGVEADYSAQGYRDDGSSVVFTWVSGWFTGQDGPYGNAHVWTSSIRKLDSGSYFSNGILGCGCMIYYYDQAGFGSWNVLNVDVGLSIPPLSGYAVLYENLDAYGCFQEQNTFLDGGTGSYVASNEQTGTSFPQNPQFSYGSATFKPTSC